MVDGRGKFEEVMVCGQEIAASTAQLVSASRVKAPGNSKAKGPLEESSKRGAYNFQNSAPCLIILPFTVSEATKTLIEAARNAGKTVKTVTSGMLYKKN